MRILAFDSSNQPMSVALVEDSNLIAEKTINIKRNHSIQLMPAIEELIEEVNWNIKDIDRIAVAKGPGSYTGVRIAVTIAKTLAWTMESELVGISSLRVLAMNAQSTEDHLIVPIFDARRENVYTGLYRVKENGIVQPVDLDTHRDSQKWANYLASFSEPIEFVGQDVEKFQERLRDALGENFIYYNQYKQVPRASALAEIAISEGPVDIHLFTPEYLKLAEAEENWKEAHPNEERGSFVEKI